MKLLAIRGEGLASLERPFEVVLDAEPIRSAGTFVLTGATGAGKSTLLDAMCLALFDRAPRLESAPRTPPVGDELRPYDPRSLVRRGARLGCAEVDFAGRGGRRYRARWEVRARKRTEGETSLGRVAMALIDLETMLPIGTTKTDVLREIELRLGYDYGQFCRSVLLPQTDLAAFLELSDDERARLLERITGTALYSELSRIVHSTASQRSRAVREARERARIEPPLDSVLRGELERQHSTVSLEEDRATTQRAEIEQRLARAEKRSEAQRDCSAAELRLEAAEAHLAAWSDKRTHLERVEATRAIAPLRAEALRHERLQAAIAMELDEAGARQLQQRTACTRAGESREERERSLGAFVAQLPELELELARWETERQAILAAESALSEARLSALSRRRERQAANAELEAATKSVKAFRRELESLDATIESLPLPPLDHVATLVRSRWVPDTPCPVCGSTDSGHTDPRASPDASRFSAEFARVLTQRDALEPKRDRLEKELTRAEATLETRRDLLRGLDARATEAEQRLQTETTRLTAAKHALRETWGDEDRRSRLRDHERALRVAADEARAVHLRAMGEVRAADESARQLELRLRHACTETERVRRDLETTKQRVGFVDDDTSLLDSLSGVDTSEWASEIERAETEVIACRAVLTELRRRLEDLAGAPEESAIPGLRMAVSDLLARSRSLQSERARLEAALTLDDERRAREATLVAALDEAESALAPWLELDTVLGSADGKKLRQLVQEMALDRMLDEANSHLETLAPRYRLKRRAEGLGLDVTDTELGGPPRATSSLSGGERFLVSLALALGLGSMTHTGGEAGTLFLDEGLASLDEASLEQALDALEALQQTGRQVGIVSHLPRVAERFEVRIEIIPQGGGASIVRVRDGEAHRSAV